MLPVDHQTLIDLQLVVSAQRQLPLLLLSLTIVIFYFLQSKVLDLTRQVVHDPHEFPLIFFALLDAFEQFVDFTLLLLEKELHCVVILFEQKGLLGFLALQFLTGVESLSKVQGVGTKPL